MRHSPIPFSGLMVRALLDGRKTQTRRHVRDTGLYAIDACIHGETPAACKLANLAMQSLYGQPRNCLWVREPWRSTADLNKHNGNQIADLCLDAGYNVPRAPIQYEADGARRDGKHTSTPPHGGPPEPGRYRHGRFMPRWASRLVLKITNVRVERWNEISGTDARAERCDPWIGLAGVDGVTVGELVHWYRRAFQHLWEQINGAGAWGANPWVWVVEFRRADTDKKEM